MKQPARRITTTTKNALITTQLSQCETYPHRVKVSIVGVGNVGMACAMAILMRVQLFFLFYPKELRRLNKKKGHI